MPRNKVPRIRCEADIRYMINRCTKLFNEAQSNGWVEEQWRWMTVASTLDWVLGDMYPMLDDLLVARRKQKPKS